MISFFDPTDPCFVLTRRRVIWLSILGLSAVLLAFTARPLYLQIKLLRARQLASQAMALVREEKFTEASEKARGAFLLRRDDPQVLRALAQASSPLDGHLGLQLWQTLLATRKATREDQRAFVELALRMGRAQQAYEELQELMIWEPAEPRHLWLLSQVCLAVGATSEALEFASSALKADPENQLYQLTVSTLLYDSTYAERRDSARANLWRLAATPTKEGLRAGEFFARRRDLLPDETRKLLGFLESHPLSGTLQRLTALGLRTRLDPERKTEIVDQAMNEYQGQERDAVNQFALWLNGRREFERTCQVLPIELARTRRDSLIIHLDALGGMDRWAEIEEILETDEMALSRTVRTAFRARCAIKLRNRASAELRWRQALDSADDNILELWFLARYAEKNQEEEYVEKVYRKLVEYSPNPRAAYLALLNLVDRSYDTARTRELLGEMARRWPNDYAVQNDYAYLSLLAGEEVGASKVVATRLVNEHPGYLPLRTTLALAHYRSGEFGEALKAYAGRDFDWRLALPGNRAVYAAVLSANARADEARALVRDLPRSSLRPEELELVEFADIGANPTVQAN